MSKETLCLLLARWEGWHRQQEAPDTAAAMQDYRAAMNPELLRWLDEPLTRVRI